MNFKSLGLKCGIEIHQQLDTKRKLFCYCPTIQRDVEESNFEFFRFLRSKKSEIGEVDRAAEEEVARSKKFIYKSYNTTCLVEADEEPPSKLNGEALEISVQIAKMLNMHLVDVVHVMRKLVIDGSNTTGFQRTALLGFDGFIEVDGNKIGIENLCLEEEACRKISDKKEEVTYSLDRLGIPLVEVGTAADIKTPEQAKKVAWTLGMILRSTGRVKRGLGTIRQDVNISIKEGARVEIKGVQSLDILDLVVEYEALRQKNLVEIRDKLTGKKSSVVNEVFDFTEIFSNTQSKVLKRSKSIKGIVLKGFAGFVGLEIQPGRRLGTEFADIAKMFGLGGIFHTDELPAYGVTEEEVEEMKKFVGSSEDDAIVIAAGDPSRIANALRRIISRAEYCLEGVPEETRKANEDGTTSYLRPLPGAARMYPETDVPSVTLTGELLEVQVPELITERAERYKKMGLSEDLAGIMANSEYHRLFEEYAKVMSPNIVSRVIHSAPSELKKEGIDVSALKEEQFEMAIRLIKNGTVAKEGAGDVLKILLEKPSISEEEITNILGQSGDIDSFIEGLINEKKDFILEKGNHAFKPLMGIVMKEFRGKVDGKIISEKLKDAIAKLG